MHPTHTATLTEIQPIARDTFYYKLAMQEPVSFEAGQFFNLHVPEAKPRPERSYSIYSPPYQTDTLELCIKHLPGGAASQYLAARSIGDTLILRGPFGHFTLPEGDDPVTMVATATGLAPFRSILLQAIHERSTRKYHLYFGVRSQEDLFALNELKSWEKQLDLKVCLCLSQPVVGWDCPPGRVTELIRRAHHDTPPTGAWMLCGNGPMITELRTFLKESGMDRKKIHYEKYF